MKNKEWITNRRPTEDDADRKGYVWCWNLRRKTCHWNSMKGRDPETPWSPRVKLKQTKPAPYVAPETKAEAMDQRECEARACVPDGYVVLGRGALKSETLMGIVCHVDRGSEWSIEAYWNGSCETMLYATKYDSEICRELNLGKWDKTRLPEPPDLWSAYEDHGWGGLGGVEHDGFLSFIAGEWGNYESGVKALADPDHYYLTKKTPKKVYWDCPEDFPPVCWFINDAWGGSRLVIAFGLDQFKDSEGFTYKYTDLESLDFRWSTRPFSKFNDGMECVK